MATLLSRCPIAEGDMVVKVVEMEVDQTVTGQRVTIQSMAEMEEVETVQAQAWQHLQPGQQDCRCCLGLHP